MCSVHQMWSFCCPLRMESWTYFLTGTDMGQYTQHIANQGCSHKPQWSVLHYVDRLFDCPFGSSQFAVPLEVHWYCVTQSLHSMWHYWSLWGSQSTQDSRALRQIKTFSSATRGQRRMKIRPITELKSSRILCVHVLRHVWLFVTPWTAACPSPLSMGILQARILEWVAMSSSRAQWCPALCEFMDCSPPGSSVHETFQARILEWVAISSSGDLPDPGIEPRLLYLLYWRVDSLPLFVPLGKPQQNLRKS